MTRASSFLLLALMAGARASDLVEVGPLTDRLLLLRFKDGYVIPHKRGEPRTAGRVITDPLDVAAAARPASYRIASPGDPAYQGGASPTRVNRKSKGTDFAWFQDRWVDGRTVNDRPDSTQEHWLTLTLPAPLKTGVKYSLATGALAKNGRVFPFVFDPRKGRSEAVHVNSIGYVPTAPKKYGYLSYWTGDGGGLDVRALVGRGFSLVDLATGKDAFVGKVAFRRASTDAETLQVGDTPNGNFQAADVAEMDFSPFAKPGRYVLSVAGVGASWPFTVGDDVYREPFRTVARGIFFQRSGIELKPPYAPFTRPAPHRVGVTPGFKLAYSSLSLLDFGGENPTRERLEKEIKGPLEAWGWYQDAGDWDSYPSHFRVAQELLLAYELNPKAFADGELNIPESGNGVPDILDEAAWLPRFGRRLRAELLKKKYGTGGIGMRVAGDVFGSDTKEPGGIGRGSWEDTDRLWVASGEDPLSTFRYAGAAAQLASAQRLAGVKDPEGADWTKEARESFAWALANTTAKDEAEVRPQRLYAAAALFRLTGEKPYEEQVRKDFRDGVLLNDDLYGPALYALGGEGDRALLTRVRAAIERTADASVASAEKRAMRWGGDFGFPMLVGQQSTPLVLDVAIARAIASDPAKKRTYEATLYTTADYFLGANALNTTWVTGLGPRRPERVFNMDLWYIGDGKPWPGIVPYAPWRKEKDLGQGPWDHDWVNATVYPKIDLWPGAERWFDNRNTPLESEYTVHQNQAPTAAIFGILLGSKR